MALVPRFGEEGSRLVTHGFCPDGMISAIVMWSLFPDHLSDIAYATYPQRAAGKVDYRESDIVVDFPCPDTGEVLFWADHHATGLKNPDYAGQTVYDPTAKSCAGLLYRHFLADHPELERFSSLIEDGEMMDSASYLRPEDLYDLGREGLVLRYSFMAGSSGYDADDLASRFIVNVATAEDWRKEFRDPVIRGRALWQMEQMESYRKNIAPYLRDEGGVVRLEVDSFVGGHKDRYCPFVLFPDSCFLFEFYPVRARGKTRISVSENPFRKDEAGEHPSSLDLGKLMQEFTASLPGSHSGGGHKGIGSYDELPRQHMQLARDFFLPKLDAEAERIRQG